MFATSLLKSTEGFTRLLPTVVCLIGYVVSFALRWGIALLSHQFSANSAVIEDSEEIKIMPKQKFAGTPLAKHWAGTP